METCEKCLMTLDDLPNTKLTDKQNPGTAVYMLLRTHGASQ